MQEIGMVRVTLGKFGRRMVQVGTSLVAFSCVATAQQQISIRGTDTLIYLSQRFAAIYSRTSPDTHISVQGGGTAAAVVALTAGQTDLAQFEGNHASSDSAEVVSFPVGVQAIVVYVNQSNPVRELTLGQLRSIFMGEITNWKSLGGPDLTINLYAGESSTGTLAFFREFVLQGEEPYPFVGKSNTKALLEEIAQHPEAIGYGSLASGPGVRAIAIKRGPASLAVSPDEQAIRSRRYLLTRPVSWAVRRQHPQTVDAFCRWVLSGEGQIVVESVGFEPLLPGDRASALASLRNLAALKQARW